MTEAAMTGPAMTGLTKDSDARIGRALRALEISGRRLFRMKDGAWGVTMGNDRRRKPLVTLSAESVKQLVGEGRLVAGEEETFLLPTAQPAMWKPLPPRAVLASFTRRRGQLNGGIGFAGLVALARDGQGLLSLRLVQAGQRLAADAERAMAGAAMTMNWDAGPVTRQRRAGSTGGRQGDALRASKTLRELQLRMGEPEWTLVWMLCVNGEPLGMLKRKLGIGQTEIRERVAHVLEALAAAYES